MQIHRDLRRASYDDQGDGNAPSTFLGGLQGRWLILFSHRADFTPVCTAEFIGFGNAAETFKGMNRKDVIAPPPKTADAAEKRATEGYKTPDWYFSTKSL